MNSHFKQCAGLSKTISARQNEPNTRALCGLFVLIDTFRVASETDSIRLSQNCNAYLPGRPIRRSGAFC